MMWRRALFLLAMFFLLGWVVASCESHEQEIEDCIGLEGTSQACDVDDYAAIIEDMFDEGCITP